MTKRLTSGFLAFTVLLLLVFSPSVSSAGSKNACKHQWELVRTKEPTCTKKGKEYYKCSKCGKEKTEELEALGHDWSYCKILSYPTCSRDGEKECFCSRNSKHTLRETLPATGHKWSSWTTVRKATLTEYGLQTRTCSKCEIKQKRWVPFLSADWITSPDGTVTDELLTLFSRAFSGGEADTWTPVSFLASRERDGKDRCFLARSGETDPDVQPAWAVIFIHEDPSGSLSVTDIVPTDQPET